jgi:hypothetical protein
VPARFNVAKGDLTFEAGFVQPEFGLLRDPSGLLSQLYRRLEPHGLRLTDLRIERRAGSPADSHVLCYLFNHLMMVRIRVERIEVVCSDLPQEQLRKFEAGITDTLRAVKDHLPSVAFRAFTLAVGLHGRLDGQPLRQYLGHFGTNAPKELGPLTGSGTVFYFGPEGDRLLSSLTVDMSALIPDALYVRAQAVWDATKVSVESVSGQAEEFVRNALSRLGLEVLQ